jgi:hypothetical protein
MAFTVQRDKNTRSKSSTRVTSSATTSSIPPSQRKILSSALALAIQVSCACIGHFRTIGVSVSCRSLFSSRLSKEDEAYVDCPPVASEEGRGHLCWQRVIPQCVSSILQRRSHLWHHLGWWPSCALAPATAGGPIAMTSYLQKYPRHRVTMVQAFAFLDTFANLLI